MKIFYILFLTCALISNNFIGSTEITWGYNDEVEIIDDLKILSPDAWYKQYPDCRGTHQSPINIVKSETDFDKKLTTIRFNSKVLDYGSNSVWIRKNTGHTIQYSLTNETIYTIFNRQKFSLLQMHFHWGHSEHEIDGALYKAELHLVHQSVTNSSVIAVLGFFFEVIKINSYCVLVNFKNLFTFFRCLSLIIQI
jgi:carbonic anhydrase